MSKSLGNVIAPQEIDEKLGAEIIRLWVRVDRLLGRHRDRRQDPRARRRRLPAHPQHAALPARQHERLRSRERRRAARRDARDRPLRARARGAAPGRGPRALRGLRVPSGGRQAAGVLLRGPRRVLPRRPEGPPLHDAPKSRARRSAQTALWHITHAMLRWMAPFLSFTAEEAWKVFGAEGSPSIFVETYSDARAGPDAGAARQVDAHRATSATTSNKEIEALRADGQASARRCRPSVDDRRATPTTTRCWPALGDDLQVRAHHLGGARSQRGDAADAIDASTPSQRTEVRALLALARRRRPRPGASDDLRPLHRATCSAPAKPRTRRLMAARTTPRAALGCRWLGIALAVDRAARPVHQGADPRLLPARRRTHVTPFFNIVRAHNTRRRVLVPRRRGAAGSAGSSSASALAAAVFIVWLLRAPRRPAAVLLGARADPRRRARQRDRPPAARLRRRLPPGPLAGSATSRRSTSPTARSRSARRC